VVVAVGFLKFIEDGGARREHEHSGIEFHGLSVDQRTHVFRKLQVVVGCRDRQHLLQSPHGIKTDHVTIKINAGAEGLGQRKNSELLQGGLHTFTLVLRRQQRHPWKLGEWNQLQHFRPRRQPG
jgi:hypothetical protein